MTCRGLTLLGGTLGCCCARLSLLNGEITWPHEALRSGRICIVFPAEHAIGGGAAGNPLARPHAPHSVRRETCDKFPFESAD